MTLALGRGLDPSSAPRTAPTRSGHGRPRGEEAARAPSTPSSKGRPLGARAPGPAARRGARFATLAALATLTCIGPRAAAQPPASEVQPPSAAEVAQLEALFERLASTDEAERTAACDALTQLEEPMLPAIRAHIATLGRGRPESNWATDILNRFRRRSVVEGAEADLTAGVLAELAEDHGGPERQKVLQMAVPALLWQSLERMGTFEADQAIYPLIGVDEGLWMPEARNWVRRRGSAVMAAAIAARNHEDRHVRQWSRWAIETLSADEPGRAVQSVEPEQLPDVLRAYAMLRMQSAMRVIVSYVDSERRRTRVAARWAIEQYGGNAIWILRTAYRNETTEHADPAWGWRRLTSELYARVDTRRMAPIRRAFEAGTAARERGDLEEMGARFDDVLARTPELEDPAPMAEGYAALGDARLLARHFETAAQAYRRALRLAPDQEAAEGWRGRLELATAELSLVRGVLDRDAYARVLAADPTNERAQLAMAPRRPIATASGEPNRTPFGLAAALLLALLGVGLLYRGSDEDSEPRATGEDAPLGPSFHDDEITLADSTLPG